MKVLKFVLLGILGIVALALIVAAFIPKEFSAGAEVTINKSSKEVFEYIKHIKNQGNYDNWSRQDSKINKTYFGTDATVGFTYEWKSDKVGNGKQILTKIEEGKRIEMDLFFNNSDQANKSFMEVSPITVNQSKVKWRIDGTIPYPFNLMSLCYDMNKDFQAGLENLKTILEK